MHQTTQKDLASTSEKREASRVAEAWNLALNPPKRALLNNEKVQTLINIFNEAIENNAYTVVAETLKREIRGDFLAVSVACAIVADSASPLLLGRFMAALSLIQQRAGSHDPRYSTVNLIIAYNLPLIIHGMQHRSSAAGCSRALALFSACPLAANAGLAGEQRKATEALLNALNYNRDISAMRALRFIPGQPQARSKYIVEELERKLTSPTDKKRVDMTLSLLCNYAIQLGRSTDPSENRLASHVLKIFAKNFDLLSKKATARSSFNQTNHAMVAIVLLLDLKSAPHEQIEKLVKNSLLSRNESWLARVQPFFDLAKVYPAPLARIALPLAGRNEQIDALIGAMWPVTAGGIRAKVPGNYPRIPLAILNPIHVLPSLNFSHPSQVKSYVTEIERAVKDPSLQIRKAAGLMAACLLEFVVPKSCVGSLKESLTILLSELPPLAQIELLNQAQEQSKLSIAKKGPELHRIIGPLAFKYASGPEFLIEAAKLWCKAFQRTSSVPQSYLRYYKLPKSKFLKDHGLPSYLDGFWATSCEQKNLAHALILHLKTIVELDRSAPTNAQKLYETFGIMNFGRYSAEMLIKQLEHLDAAQYEKRRPRRYIAVFNPLSDHNGAMLSGEDVKILWRQANKFPRPPALIVCESGTLSRLLRQHLRIARLFGPIKYAFIDGHGDVDGFTLSYPSVHFYTKDVANKRAGKFLRRLYSPDAQILIGACSGGAENGVAHATAKHFSRRNVTITAQEGDGYIESLKLVRSSRGKLYFKVRFSPETSSAHNATIQIDTASLKNGGFKRSA